MRDEGGQVIDSTNPLCLARMALYGASSRPFGKDALSQSTSIACEHWEGWSYTTSEEKPNYGETTAAP